jgi:CRISPR/Cas system-associated exonuclease Cas4 (RecB family)
MRAVPSDERAAGAARAGAEARALPRPLNALAAVASAYPLDRKLVVCRRARIGRELLRTLAARGVAWVNFEVTTPLQLAHDLVAGELAASGLRVADEFDELEQLDAAVDAVLQHGAGRLAQLADAPGLRRAIAASVRTLRNAGLDAAALQQVRFRDEDKRREITAILTAYESRLAGASLVDSAAVFARARAVLLRDMGTGESLLPAHVCVMESAFSRGVAGELLKSCVMQGAVVLGGDPVMGLARPAAWPVHAAATDASSERSTPEPTPSPAAEPGPNPTSAPGPTALSWLHDPAAWLAAAVATHDAAGVDATAAAPEVVELTDARVRLDVFAATSVTAELREVLRRVLAAGLRWDEVEIIATDAARYGLALDGLASRAGVSVTYALGLPVGRTRPGRAAGAWLDWARRGWPAESLRQMLERGDIVVPGHSGVRLGRRVRTLRPVRGRSDYAAAFALARRAAVDTVPELDALDAFVRGLLGEDPEQDGAVTVRDLAGGLLFMLEHAPAASDVEAAARQRMTEKLRRLAAMEERRVRPDAALARLATVLDDHVPGGDPPSWVSVGGHLHLSDVEHGGYSGRRATFIVGLDAGRFPGIGSGDALLVDDDRRRLMTGEPLPALALSQDRIDEARHAFAVMVTRLRGSVTFSYPTWDAVEGRGIAPAAELLQVYRLITGDVTADYEQLHDATLPAASAIPRGSALLDADDAWLHLLTADNGRGGRTLQRGVELVCSRHGGLAAGVAAFRARRRTGLPTTHHGLIHPRPELDPRSEPVRAVSPTELQTLAACPLRYLHRYVLRLQPPETRRAAPDEWLTPQERGTLLHAVFENALRSAREQNMAADVPALGPLALRLLDERVEALRQVLPPAGPGVFGNEVERLREDVLAFAAMVADDGLRFVDVERRFGWDGEPPALLTLPDGSELRLSGIMDRVDRLADGSLVVVDYKTGSTVPFGGKSGVFDGGRRLQHVLYAAAAERMFDAPVSRAEYHFPTRHSQSHRVRYGREQMRDGLAIVVDLLELVRNGWFVPTNDPDDCKYCDYATVCRAGTDPYGRVDSPLAEWSRESDGEAVDLLRSIRR